ncbi:hypothetical protein SRHO_G00104890 [Serrasalmus rhombeus]
MNINELCPAWPYECIQQNRNVARKDVALSERYYVTLGLVLRRVQAVPVGGRVFQSKVEPQPEPAFQPGGRVGYRRVLGVQSLSGGAARCSSVPASGPQRPVNTEPLTRRLAVLIQRVLC